MRSSRPAGAPERRTPPQASNQPLLTFEDDQPLDELSLGLVLPPDRGEASIEVAPASILCG
jgi:hypothetical protein